MAAAGLAPPGTAPGGFVPPGMFNGAPQANPNLLAAGFNPNMLGGKLPLGGVIGPGGVKMGYPYNTAVSLCEVKSCVNFFIKIYMFSKGSW